jgi:uncharacterized protein (TIGR02145 family)
VNVGTNSTTYTYVPVDHDKITCVMTSNYTATCLSNNPATSNTIIAVVYPTPGPGIPSPCVGAETVNYGGQVYNTVQIGTQCWFRENLNTGTRINGGAEQTNNGIVEKYCFNNLESNCDIYGGMYQWAEIVQYLNGASNTTSWNPVPAGNVQGICPPGWHMPSDAEWTSLTTFLGGEPIAGGKIKESGTAHWVSPNAGATNETGFTALPGGNHFFGNFSDMGLYVNFWSSTEISATNARSRALFYQFTTVGRGNSIKDAGFHCRCLKD